MYAIELSWLPFCWRSVASGGFGSCSFAQFLARLEMRNIFGRNLDGFPGFRIPAIAREAIVQVEDAESADFNALPDHEAVTHDVENRLHDYPASFITRCG